MKNKLKVGVLGAGHLGKIHLKLLNQSERYELIGFYDPNKLIEAVEVVDIVTPTLSHYECALKAIAAKRHIFIEKPITSTVAEAEEIYRLLEANQLKGQVGHVERFNPAFQAAKSSIANPMFIEVHRLAEFNPRGTDVSVVLDLMIHDIDVLLSVVDSPVKHIEASGVAVISKSPDITNARIEFKNGCVANLTASRISMKNMRKSRFFQKDAYISVDFLEKKVEVIHMKDAPEEVSEYDMILQNAEGERKQIYFEYPEVQPTNAILEELETFADAIEHNTTPVVTFLQGTKALRLAKDIVTKIEENFK